MRIFVVRSRMRLMTRDAAVRHQESWRICANRSDVVGAGVQRGDYRANFLRRILQVGIQRDRDAAAHALESGENGQVLAGIARQHDGAHAVRMCRHDFAKQGGRVVAAAVVDEDHFIGSAQCVERREEAREQQRQSRALR